MTYPPLPEPDGYCAITQAGSVVIPPSQYAQHNAYAIFTADQMHDYIAPVLAERDALKAELELRRKSGSASDRLHNLVQGIAEDADGSEWSREEWERLDAENAALREQVRVLRDALNAMLTHMGMDEDDWNKPTYDQARAALAATKEKIE